MVKVEFLSLPLQNAAYNIKCEKKKMVNTDVLITPNIVKREYHHNWHFYHFLLLNLSHYDHVYMLQNSKSQNLENV